MKRIVIIGGGIAGLSAAFYLEQAKRSGAALDYVLFEASERLGGVLRTERVDDCLVEAGPDSFLTEKLWAAELCRELGLADQLIGSNDGLRRTWIVVNRRLRPLPDGLQFMVPTRTWPIVFSRLFSTRTKLRMIGELFSPAHSSPADESAAALVERHFGREVVERLADPLLAGVYGGDATRLSARAVLPRFAAMEAQTGSLIRGMLAARRKHAGAPPQPLFTSLKGGMQQLVDAVVARLQPSALRTAMPVTGLRREGARWLVTLASGPAESFDSVVLAVPAFRASDLLEPASSALAAVLAQIPYNNAMTVALGFDAESLLPSLRWRFDTGHGFLVPRREGRCLLACTYVHNKFPHRAPKGRLLLRTFLNDRHRDLVGLSDEEAVQVVRLELRYILGLYAEPRFVRLYRWPAAMAQYEVGHLDRLAEIALLRQSLPGLALIGNAYRGIGVPDCIRSGRDAAAEIVNSLQLSS
ncbi:MAG TPA: protoporphyrinogen oxidase [Terriglobales bacterium]|nr:protoporphyrinogen oxidase [Terriglobales bacterium]